VTDVSLATNPPAGQGPDPAPDEQDGTESSQEGAVVEGDADDEHDRSDDGADDGAVVTSEEKQHGMTPFLVCLR
jgi:hypothetical protein